MKIQKRQISFLPKNSLKKRTHRLGLRWKLGLLHWTWGFRNFCESARFFFLFYSLGWLLARQEAAYRRLDPTKAALVCSHWMKEHKILSGFKEPASKILVKVHGCSLFLSWLVVGPIRGDLQKVEFNKSSFGLFTLNEGQTFLRPDQKSLCRPVCKPSVHFEASLFALGSFSTFCIWATLCHQFWSCDDWQNHFQTKKSRFFTSRSNKAVVVHCSSFLFNWSFLLCPWFFFFLHFISL